MCPLDRLFSYPLILCVNCKFLDGATSKRRGLVNSAATLSTFSTIAGCGGAIGRATFPLSPLRRRTKKEVGPTSRQFVGNANEKGRTLASGRGYLDWLRGHDLNVRPFGL